MENNLFKYPKLQRINGSVQTSVLVSNEFYKLAKQHNIKFSEALRVGLSLMFAEMGLAEYDNSLNLHRKMNMFREKLEEASKELAELKQKSQ